MRAPPCARLSTLASLERWANKTFRHLGHGVPDGLRVDECGNVWISSGPGMEIHAGDGAPLGTHFIPEAVANLSFGGPKNNRLFITASTSVYAVYTAVRGAVAPALARLRRKSWEGETMNEVLTNPTGDRRDFLKGVALGTAAIFRRGHRAVSAARPRSPARSASACPRREGNATRWPSSSGSPTRCRRRGRRGSRRS